MCVFYVCLYYFSFFIFSGMCICIVLISFFSNPNFEVCNGEYITVNVKDVLSGNKCDE